MARSGKTSERVAGVFHLFSFMCLDCCSMPQMRHLVKGFGREFLHSSKTRSGGSFGQAGSPCAAHDDMRTCQCGSGMRETFSFRGATLSWPTPTREMLLTHTRDRRTRHTRLMMVFGDHSPRIIARSYAGCQEGIQKSSCRESSSLWGFYQMRLTFCQADLCD